MAYTATLLEDSVHGNHRVRIFQVATDAAAGNFNTGLNRVSALSVTFKSCTTAGPSIQRNKSATGTVANGYVCIASAASTDVFEIVCYGN